MAQKQQQTQGNLPTKRRESFVQWARQNQQAIISAGAAFIDQTARERMLKKNLEYILSQDFKKAWNTEEGVLSIQAGLEESLYYAATMPETGCLVPFGDVVEFVPSVHVFKSALTTGEKAPCTNVIIECIHENDQYEIFSESGNFSYQIKKIGFPRGEIIGVVVVAIKKDGSQIGNAFDVNKLMEKAAAHSTAYKYYLADMAALAKAKSEKKDYIMKWEKKYYEKDIVSPYVGADRPQMLMKLAGKSFLYPLFKEQMLNAVISETEQSKAQPSSSPIDIIQNSIEPIKTAIENKKAEPIQDAEFTIEDDTPPQATQKEKDLIKSMQSPPPDKAKKKGLFND
jgi:hypothetical protein